MAMQPAVYAQLHKIIWHALDNHLLPSAIFAAERLLAYDPKNQDSLYLMALCCFRDGRTRQAEYYSQAAIRHIGCIYIYAQCCWKRKKYFDGAEALERSRPLWAGTSHWNQHSDTERHALPDGASIACLLGHLQKALHDNKKAVEAYVQALKWNPTLWEAFAGLCETGVTTRVNNVFKPSEEMLKAARVMGYTSGNEFSIPEDSTDFQAENQNTDPFTGGPSTRSSQEHGYGQPPPLSVKVNEGSTLGDVETPPTQSSDGFINGPYATGSALEHPRAPSRKTRAQQFSDGPRKMLSTKLRDMADQPPERKRTISSANDALQVPSAATTAPARRSSRLLNTSKITSKFASGQREVKKPKPGPARTRSLHMGGERAERAAATAAQSNGDVSMTDARSLPAPVLTRMVDTRQEDAQLVILDLYRKIGSGCYLLSRYDCKGALDAFQAVSNSHRETAFVLCKMARAHYEMTNYKEAEALYLRVRAIDPMRVLDMEIYSTVLWHLRSDVELSHLAHGLSKIDRSSAQAWCALGNSFSLIRDHDQALRCFKRATQLDDKLAYAFTLQGHEYMSNEEVEKAQTSYRIALNADSRHYPAWYGMGKVYEKLGKYEMADKHFRTAVAINPMNNVLICCVGYVLEKNKNFKAALVHYTKACELAPKSAMPKFKKARVLVALGQEHAALTELLICKDLVPDEANVHFNLGKLYKRFGDKQNSIKYFTAALHLDPKASAAIKEAIESMDTDDVDPFATDDPDSYRSMDS